MSTRSRLCSMFSSTMIDMSGFVWRYNVPTPLWWNQFSIIVVNNKMHFWKWMALWQGKPENINHCVLDHCNTTRTIVLVDRQRLWFWRSHTVNRFCGTGSNGSTHHFKEVCCFVFIFYILLYLYFSKKVKEGYLLFNSSMQSGGWSNGWVTSRNGIYISEVISR